MTSFQVADELRQPTWHLDFISWPDHLDDGAELSCLVRDKTTAHTCLDLRILTFRRPEEVLTIHVRGGYSSRVYLIWFRLALIVGVYISFFNRFIWECLSTAPSLSFAARGERNSQTHSSAAQRRSDPIGVVCGHVVLFGGPAYCRPRSFLLVQYKWRPSNLAKGPMLFQGTREQHAFCDDHLRWWRAKIRRTERTWWATKTNRTIPSL